MAQSVYFENVRDLIDRPGGMRERERTLTVPERLGEALITVPAGESMHLDVRLESVHEGILATVSAQTTAHGECGRCLEPFTEELEVEFQELFAYSLDEVHEYGVHGDHVDLEPPLRDAVVLSLPFQPVCRPDCPGIDPVTGEKRQEGDVEADADEIDSRWAALSALMTTTDSGDDENASDPHQPREETR